MYLNDLNFISLVFYLLLIFFFINFNNTFQSLIISEFLWITLYVWAFLLSIIINDLNILALTLFFLVFSAIEISVGLVILVLQKTIFRSLNTYLSSNKLNFNIFRFLRSFFLKKYQL